MASFDSWRPGLDRLLRYVVAAIVLGVAANLTFAVLTLEPASLSAARSFAPSLLALAAVLALVPWLTNALRVGIWSSFLGRRLAFRESLRIVLGTELASAITPTAMGGGYMKLALLVQNGHAPGAAASLMTLASVEDAIVFAVLVPVAVVVTESWELPFVQSVFHAIGARAAWAVGIGGGLVLLVLVVAFLWRRSRLPGWSGPRWLAPVRPRLKRSWEEFFGAYCLIARGGKGWLLLSLSLTAIQWICRYSVITALLASLNVPVDPVRFFLLQWVVFTLMIFVPTPGAAVGAEASLYAVYTAFVPDELLGFATAGWRFLTFYLPLSLDVFLFPLLGLSTANARPVARRGAEAAAQGEMVTDRPGRISFGVAATRETFQDISTCDDIGCRHREGKI